MTVANDKSHHMMQSILNKFQASYLKRPIEYGRSLGELRHGAEAVRDMWDGICSELYASETKMDCSPAPPQRALYPFEIDLDLSAKEKECEKLKEEQEESQDLRRQLGQSRNECERLRNQLKSFQACARLPILPGEVTMTVPEVKVRAARAQMEHMQTAVAQTLELLDKFGK